MSLVPFHLLAFNEAVFILPVLAVTVCGPPLCPPLGSFPQATLFLLPPPHLWFLSIHLTSLLSHSSLVSIFCSFNPHPHPARVCARAARTPACMCLVSLGL